ncbi:GGDEF domain-containing protein [Roseospira marina]|uniref:GGDEF domain-containing protein n=1 Tax=Roseospira marina TaxID=140057 RepID=UPI00184B0898|nr:GGDEF domain-containing protein [Roseospira marina]MBB4315515.1 diguanylate cyclase (GGDEF)-like protein [Roseospira marina]MBB5088548.1 diguanylate cyclase (GGDEF)-like protein [Roseospira marina]
MTTPLKHSPDDAAEFSLFEVEERVLREADAMVRKLDEVAGGVNALAAAYRRGYREQRRLVRLSDRMQGELHQANRHLTDQAQALKKLNAALEAEIVERERLTLELERLATVDELTGLAGRRHFMVLAERERARTERFVTCLSVLMLDLDRFKAINDTHGHGVGDAVLRAFGAVLQRELRQIDVAGRLGGEEFAVLLPGANLGHGLEVAERLRAGTAEIGRNSADLHRDSGAEAPPVPVTVSIGVTTFMPGDTLDALLKRADTALYAAKRAGRDRVLCWTSAMSDDRGAAEAS